MRDSGIISNELGEYQEHQYRTWNFEGFTSFEYFAGVSFHNSSRPHSFGLCSRLRAPYSVPSLLASVPSRTSLANTREEYKTQPLSNY